MFEGLINSLLGITADLGHLGVFVLMAVESSFIPFPSEIVVPPAAYLAYSGEMNIFLVVLAGVAGSLVGASLNYFLARWLGRPIVYGLVEKKWAKFLLLNKNKLEHAEKHFRDYGGVSTFLGRLVPGVRQLISIPAGFSKMNFWKFLFYTFLGSGFWVIVLALLGWFLGGNQEVLMAYYGEITLVLIGIVLVVILFFLYRRRKKRLN